jgi:hypothetical protein
MDPLTQLRDAPTLCNMRLTATLVPITTPALGVPAVLYTGMPGWCLLVLLGVTVLLTTAQVTVTQIIRLRASTLITRSQDAVRVLEIEDLSLRHHRMNPRSMTELKAGPLHVDDRDR